jgi:hypothetical protein
LTKIQFCCRGDGRGEVVVHFRIALWTGSHGLGGAEAGSDLQRTSVHSNRRAFLCDSSNMLAAAFVDSCLAPAGLPNRPMGLRGLVQTRTQPISLPCLTSAMVGLPWNGCCVHCSSIPFQLCMIIQS